MHCLNSTQEIRCDYRYNVPNACRESPTTTYGYAWYVYDCPKGCDPELAGCRPSPIGGDGGQDVADAGANGRNEDAQPDACCEGSEARRCANDHQKIVCEQWDTTSRCGASPGGPYVHVWSAYDCPKGCEGGECRQ